jgi:hypothetical protein
MLLLGISMSSTFKEVYAVSEVINVEDLSD